LYPHKGDLVQMLNWHRRV